MRYRVVLDTNVVLAAVRSRSGASAALLRRLALNRIAGNDEFVICLSTALVLEYEEILMRFRADISSGWSEIQVEQFVVALCGMAEETPIYFRWRPFLRDVDDDMVVEAAMAGGCRFIVTFNERDFRGVDSLGLQTLTPGEFLRHLDETKV